MIPKPPPQSQFNSLAPNHRAGRIRRLKAAFPVIACSSTIKFARAVVQTAAGFDILMRMANTPETSASLLKIIANDSENARWAEFYYKYEATIRSFVAAHYPTLEPDDIVQETMFALFRRLPNYHYAPDKHGHFRSYLMGIVCHKAADAIRKRVQQEKVRQGITTSTPVVEEPPIMYEYDEAWSTRDKEIFRRVALQGESPEDVAAIFDIKRNNVDQIKSRLTDRLSQIIAAMLGDDA